MLFNHDLNIKANKGRPRVWSPVGCPLVLLLLLTFTLCHSTSELQPIQLQDVRDQLELAQAKLVEVQQILGKLSGLVGGGQQATHITPMSLDATHQTNHPIVAPMPADNHQQQPVAGSAMLQSAATGADLTPSSASVAGQQPSDAHVDQGVDPAAVVAAAAAADKPSKLAPKHEPDHPAADQSVAQPTSSLPAGDPELGQQRQQQQRQDDHKQVVTGENTVSSSQLDLAQGDYGLRQLFDHPEVDQQPAASKERKFADHGEVTELVVEKTQTGATKLEAPADDDDIRGSDHLAPYNLQSKDVPSPVDRGQLPGWPVGTWQPQQLWSKTSASQHESPGGHKSVASASASAPASSLFSNIKRRLPFRHTDRQQHNQRPSLFQQHEPTSQLGDATGAHQSQQPQHQQPQQPFFQFGAQQLGPDENRRHLGKWRRFASGPIKHPRANLRRWGSLGRGKLGELAERVSQNELLYNTYHKIKNRAQPAIQAGLQQGREAVTLVQDGARQAYGRIKRRTSRRRLKRGPRGGGDNVKDDTDDDQDDDDQEDDEGEISKQKTSGRVLLPFSRTLPDMIGKVARVPPVAASSWLDQNNHHQNNHHPIQHHQHHDSRREDIQLSNGGHSFKRSRSYVTSTSMSTSSSISSPSPNVPPPV